MPPTTKIGGGGWSCGARAKHNHRKRLRDPEFFTIRTTTYGVASSSCRASQRQQRQQLAPRASRWRCGGAKQKTLAPREGQALEERSSSSRSTSWTRTRGQQLPYVRRRQRQQLAPRASRWRTGAARAPREGQAQQGGPGKAGGDLAHQGRHERVIARGVQQPCVTTTTAAARARQARRANGHFGQVLASVRGSVPAAQGPRAVAQPAVRLKNERRASSRRQRRTSASHDDDGSSRSRSAAELALEGRGCTAVPHHREQGAATAARGRGCSPRRSACSPCVIVTTAAVRAS